MCGITGIIDKKGKVIMDSVLRNANDIIKHRGPDGEGFYHHNNIGLAHRRLSIIDLSEEGKQPMTYDQDNYVITFNGEIYNYIELKEELLKLGHEFNNKTDTEVILAAYKEWGDSCVQKFNGMWAFAILDKTKEILFLSRDRFGIKPLYYYSDENIFIFGSEIKQLLPSLPSIKVNRQIMFDYLMINKQNHSNETFFKNIDSLPNGHNAIYNLKTNEYNILKYYTLNQKEEFNDLSNEELYNSFEKTLNDSIKLRLRSDVKVGSCLSGGMDSSAITAKAAVMYKEQNPKKKFYSITAKSEDIINDESEFAKLVVDQHKLDWNVTEPSYSEYKEISNNLSYILEEPFKSNSYHMQYFVMEKAKKDNCIVLLDGQGGDESLLGYEIYYIPYLNQLKGWINKIKALKSITGNSKLSNRDIFIYYFYFNFFFIKKLRFKRKSKYIRKEFSKYFNNQLLIQNSFKKKSIFEIQKHHFLNFQIKNQLVFADKIAMWHSIEARFPMIDHRFIETSLSLPLDFKINEGWTKYVLRKISEEILPKEVVWRTNKMGFESPLSWAKKNDEMLKTIKKSKFIKNFVDVDVLSDKIDENTILRLHSLSIWAKTFNVSF
ncbi:asparagine synthase (glutamine-hydrolysing) [Aquimarina sp. MAR_2010_214]|uniref:asparagine synthase (glutamine-hydrolyzing) n=1 Tax=Aquimarina sp. MAR_2010_214 TaxID=1250026 RepID=UPI000C70F35A|nr:asparagine synthase (glutamine-hydrolyzing) [Aquimarina sp. MAR_2010_214]PKV48776.1 asparagine synthase (glutamine-hydrolysing) [Aquimarina sp. MAR_2010_214]